MEPESSLPHSQVSATCPYILSQLDPVHIPTSHFLKIHLSIILLSIPGSPKAFLSLRFPQQNPVYATSLSHTRCMPRQTHYSQFYDPSNIIQ
jgi:hypothetical protein